MFQKIMKVPGIEPANSWSTVKHAYFSDNLSILQWTGSGISRNFLIYYISCKLQNITVFKYPLYCNISEEIYPIFKSHYLQHTSVYCKDSESTIQVYSLLWLIWVTMTNEMVQL